jgi:glyoxylase-like metal-dependent hydrolase (beta-lactamase superfamily II)
MTAYQIKVLRAGYSFPLDAGRQQANGTITLVQGDKNILVDTGSPQDMFTLLEGLEEAGLTPPEIDFVVCTHGHADHIGNNNLFPQAIFVVSQDIAQGDIYTPHDFSAAPYPLAEGIEVIATPGHSGQDVSVIVQAAEGVVAIVGDLFEREEDLTDESLWRATSQFPELQIANRRRILEIADFIVPGHGEMFSVKK